MSVSVEKELADGEFVLFYQPTVNMRVGTVTGVEALIRWTHPEDGVTLPANFLPYLEIEMPESTATDEVEKAARIVRGSTAQGVVALAHRFDRRVVANGVAPLNTGWRCSASAVSMPRDTASATPCLPRPYLPGSPNGNALPAGGDSPHPSI